MKLNAYPNKRNYGKNPLDSALGLGPTVELATLIWQQAETTKLQGHLSDPSSSKDAAALEFRALRKCWSVGICHGGLRMDNGAMSQVQADTTVVLKGRARACNCGLWLQLRQLHATMLHTCAAGQAATDWAMFV